MPELQGLRSVTPRAADVNFSTLHRTEHNQEASTQGPGTSSAQRRSGSSSRSDPPRRLQKHSGFLLEPAFTNGHAHGNASGPIGKDGGGNGQIYNDKRRAAARRESADSSRRGSPLSREVSMDDARNGSLDSHLKARAYAPGMDPVQLVQVALQLNDSRRRHVSNAIPVQQQPSLVAGTQLSPSYPNGLLSGKRLSPNTKRNTIHGDLTPSPSPRPDSSPKQESLCEGSNQNGPDTVYTFSPATLSRAEKARRYFELANEHRRLLQHLPPIRQPLSSSQSRHSPTTERTRNSRPSSAFGPVSPVESHELGRSYNPLQALRNRRLRAREKRQLSPPPESFQEIDRIRDWIDDVKGAYQHSSARRSEDSVRLPRFSEETEADENRKETSNQHHHKRTDTASTVITRPENEWSVDPTELLADTYWTEKDDNRFLLEDRRGNRLFRGYRPLSAGSELRSSHSPVHIDDAAHFRGSLEDSEIDDDSKIRPRKRNMIPIPTRLRRSGLPYVNRSASTTSLSSADGKPPGPGDFSTGPLNRHMREMIAKEERGEIVVGSPESQHHWDTNHFHNPVVHKHQDQHHSRRTEHGRLSIDTSLHRRSRSADGRARPRLDSREHAMSSVDEMTSNGFDAPTSTAHPVPSRHKRGASPASSHKRSSSFGTHDYAHKAIDDSASPRRFSQDLSNTDRLDFAGAFGSTLSPVEDTETPSLKQSTPRSTPFGHKDAQISSNLQGALIRHHSTHSVSDAKETPSSANRRFFKGSRISELVRNESTRFGERLRGKLDNRSTDAVALTDSSRVPSEPSDAEDDAPSNSARARRADTLDGTENVALSSQASFDQSVNGQSKARYRIPNLPSFKSPPNAGQRKLGRTPTDEISDPMARYQKVPQPPSTSREDRSTYTAPPQIRVADDDSASSSDAAARENAYKQQRASPRFSQFNPRSRPTSRRNSNSDTAIKWRYNVQDNPPTTDLTHLTPGASSLQRHWSISDRTNPANARQQLKQQKQHRADVQVEQITARDVARIRALLLASGIKAHAIISKANSIREPPLEMIARAARSAGDDQSDPSYPKPTSVSRRREAFVAARLLSTTIDTTLSSFDSALQIFQDNTLCDLNSRIATLRDRASLHLANAVAETSDAADAFNVELTTAQPRAIKRVDDAVDALLRRRNRKFRWLRRAGFKVLEWAVLSIMWWVWFIVVMINSARKVGWGVLQGARWLLWF